MVVLTDQVSPLLKKDIMCHYCWKKGHYKSECCKFQPDQKSGNVRQVEGGDATASGPQGAASSGDPAAKCNDNNAKAKVRRIAFDLTVLDRAP